MDKAKTLVFNRVGKRLEPSPVVLIEYLRSPIQSLSSRLIIVGVIHATADRSVMIPDDRDVRVSADQIADLVWVGAITDDVTQADDPIDIQMPNSFEDSLCGW